ncbi:flotillin family protein [Anaeromicropila herbilytica]|uniref:Flotillin n=1 Tax=Anaeromicropila herbilytica TaxID=2785025 RepID=A0A7R7ENK6_9FIRM|nr:flotillin family protein [Anaeromicropila herbilytica]BCN32160.1 flotillin [Anaeromicropila herbilytica]
MDQSLIIAIIIAAVFLLVIISVMAMWKRVPQDKALVVTGLKKRVISGGGGFVVPLLERTDKISLENMKIEVQTEGARTEQGVDIRADGVAVIKVKSDKESILSAIEQFNTGKEHQTIEVIKDTSKDVLEGKLREIISKMTVEEIYKDREIFASQVQEVAAVGLASLGLELKVFTIRDISDKNGYLEALGKPRIAEVKKNAAIAEADAAKETRIKTSESERLGAEAKIVAETQVAEATKVKELKIQAYREEQETAKARADSAYEIEKNIVLKEVTETAMSVEITKKEKETEVQLKEALRREKELEATVNKQADAELYRVAKQADADKYKVEKQSDAKKYSELKEAEAIAAAIKVKAEAEAEAIRIKGEAEAAAILAKGAAEAETMDKKAEAFKQYNNAAVTQMIIEKLPEIAKAVAEPLAKTEKIVIIDNGGKNGSESGAAKVTGYVTDIVSQLPETIEAMTGFNFLDAIKDKLDTVKTDNSEVESSIVESKANDSKENNNFEEVVMDSKETE